MDAVFEHIRADRGFIMLREEGGSLEPCVVKYRNPAEEARITISKTMADRVVHDRVAILTSDAQIDPRFSSRDSIRVHRIRSAMCAPLWKGDAVIGIIHLDTPVQGNSFTKAALELLPALANYAAVAIEQARLNQKIRDERFARERLEKYFSPSVVARILSEGEKEAQELEATILFADIVGFTRLRSEEHTSELQSRLHLVCRLLLEKKKKTTTMSSIECESGRYDPRGFLLTTHSIH